MKVSINDHELQLGQGDITDQEVDAIVNAANQALAGGGGVDGAIHRRGGPEIMAETRRRYPDGCPTGSAVISTAGKLSARYVIHAVGPFWQGGARDEERLLSSAYSTCLQLAVEHQCQSIAFPALSAGAYRYPLPEAARVALQTVIEFLQHCPHPLQVRFVLFDRRSYDQFASTLGELQKT